MESKTKPMTPFDELVSPSNFFYLKLLIPYVPKQMQRLIGIYIKYSEFMNTLHSFYGFPDSDLTKTSDNPFEIFEKLKPYLSPEDFDKFEQIESLLSMMEMMKMMQQDSDGSSPLDFSDILNSFFGNQEDTTDNC